MALAVASSGDCCKQMAEKLEKSEAGRKKLRTAIAMLKEKLEAAEQLMAVNATLRQDLERERNEREKAESSRLTLEQDGSSLKDIITAAVTRIDKLEASQANDRKEMQFLRDEVKLAIESARAAGKATEAAQGAFQSLESNLTPKVNNALSKAGQNANLQSGLKAVQANMATIQREVASLFSRAAALEKHHSLWDQHFHQNQLQQAQNQAQAQAQPGKLVNPQKPPSRAPATSLQDHNSNAKERLASTPGVVSSTPGGETNQAKERFPSTPTGGIEVIPGIGDILNRPAQRVTKPAPTKKPAAGDQSKASKQNNNNNNNNNNNSNNNNKLVVVEAVKDGSDVTVHNDSSARGGEPVQLLSSITRLFEKEKRAHSKIELKLAELEKLLGGLPSAPASAPDRKGKRKASSTSEAKQKRAKKSSGEATKKPQKNGEMNHGVFGDDSDAEEVLASKNHQEGNSEGSQDPAGKPEALAQQSGEDEQGLKNNTQVSTEEELATSDEHLDAEAFSAATRSVKRCFFDEEWRLKPSAAWSLEFKENLPTRSLMLIFTSSLTTVMNVDQSLVHQLASFVSSALDGGALDLVLRHLSGFLISGKPQYLLRDSQGVSARSGEATTLEQITSASKLLAAVCDSSGYYRLLRSMTYRILRWCEMDNSLLASILASLTSVSKRLLSDTQSSILSRALGCVISELISELENTSPELESLRLQVSSHEPVEAIVASALEHLLHPSEDPGLDLAREFTVGDLKAPETGEVPWSLRFHEAAEALELVAFQMGWEWTYNELIVGKLWSLVAPGAAQLTLAGVAYLLGSLGRQGVFDNLPGVDELRQRLAIIMRGVIPEQGKLALATRLAAARSLLELSVSDKKGPRWGDDEPHPEDLEVHRPEYVKTVQEWFQSLDAEEQKLVPACLKQRIFVR